MGEDMVGGPDPRPIHKVDSVETGPGRMLTVRWRNGGGIRVDLSGWIGFHRIERLRDDSVFRRVEVGEYGGSIYWDGDEDLSIDSVHLELLGEQQAPFAATDLAAWQDRRGVSNLEAADLIGVSVNTWLNYKAGATRIPQGVAIACRAMDRDPLLFTAHYRPRRNGRPPAAGNRLQPDLAAEAMGDALAHGRPKAGALGVAAGRDPPTAL